MVVYGILCDDNMLIMTSESASDLSSGISRAINGFGEGTGESDDKKSSVVQRSGGRLMMCCGGGMCGMSAAVVEQLVWVEERIWYDVPSIYSMMNGVSFWIGDYAYVFVGCY